MTLLLVNPFGPEDRQYGPPRMPLGFAYLAAMVRSEGRVEVHVLDKYAEYRLNGFDVAATEGMLDAALEQYRPDFVGFTSFSHTIADVLKDARRVRARLPKARIMMGGPHATACPEETIAHYHDLIDVVVRGEGEYQINDLLTDKDLAEIPGVTYWDGEKVVSTRSKPRPGILDELPFPARDVMRMDYYTAPSARQQSRGSARFATILSSRGCKLRCSFCLEMKWKRKFGAHSPEYVVREMEEVLRAYPHVERFEFIDNLFLSDPMVTEELCVGLIKSGLNERIQWKAQTTCKGVTPQMLRLMKSAGCYMLSYGFESGSQRILDRMHKHLTPEDIRFTSQITKDAGLLLEGYFIYAYPDETESDFVKTLEIIQTIKPDYVGYGPFLVVPGTREYDILRAEKRLPYLHEDLNVDWEQVNVYLDNSKVNYSAIPDDRLPVLVRQAHNDVIGPVNMRFHFADLGVRRIMTRQFASKVARNSASLFTDPAYFVERVRDVWSAVARSTRS